MKHQIDNFCDMSPLHVNASSHDDPAICALVTLHQSHGALGFQHSMRPSQARELSAILLTVAAEAERLEAVRNREEVAA